MIETKASILCALCGIKFIPTTGSICPTCTIKSLEEQKFLEGDYINYCRYCQRWQRPPWINCQRQSQQMMAILLKKIKGLNKVQLQTANFVWTEPHSKRLKLKVVFNREVNENMKIQVTEVVEFVQKFTQCNDCRKKFTPHDWIALVQVRQQTSHKKTIHNLEQALLKQRLSEKIIKTQEAEGGINLYFSNENDAMRLVDFLKSKFPTLLKTSSKLISYNERENTSNLKITHSITIPKICKDDLVHIPRKLSKELGSCCEVLLCTKVSSSLHFLDIGNFKKIQISATQYFLYQNQIQIFPIKVYGKKFTVLDCETKQTEMNNKFPIFGLTFMREEEYVERYTRCHFSDEPGNQLLGYQLTQIENIDGVKNMPDYLMVSKIRDKEQKRKNKQNKRKKQAEIRRKQRQSEALSKQRSKDVDEDDFSSQDQEDQWEDVEQIAQQQPKQQNTANQNKDQQKKQGNKQ